MEKCLINIFKLLIHIKKGGFLISCFVIRAVFRAMGLSFKPPLTAS